MEHLKGNYMTNTFRTEYRKLEQNEIDTMNGIKNRADDLLQFIIKNTEKNREQSLAITKLEETVMWAVKGVTG
jgi:hypothetical protein